MNNYFCFSVIFHKDAVTKKTKIDYALFPVEKTGESGKDFCFKSKLSEETFNVKKCHTYWEKFKKNKDLVSYMAIYEIQILDSFEEIEKCYIPVFEKQLRRKIPFHFKYKKKLNKRLIEILSYSYK